MRDNGVAEFPDPNEVNVSQPSDVLTARAAAAGTFDRGSGRWR
ncbi:MAG: hypothetical protein Q8O56_15755 [Solirubrobacteraceae bacterium]|nr:hypothetical protein [Solirubrobacteraceae bacterium]